MWSLSQLYSHPLAPAPAPGVVGWEQSHLPSTCDHAPSCWSLCIPHPAIPSRVERGGEREERTAGLREGFGEISFPIPEKPQGGWSKLPSGVDS